MNWFGYFQPTGGHEPGTAILAAMGLTPEFAKQYAEDNYNYKENEIAGSMKKQTCYTWDPKNHRPVYVEPKDIDGDGKLNWDSNGNFKIDTGDQNICPQH
jgi:hypothetical protein